MTYFAALPARLGMTAAALALLATAFSAPGVHAQSAPSETTETYGAWTVRCKTVEDGPNLCEVLQVIRPKGTQIVAQIAFGKPKGVDQMTAVFQVPAGTYLPAGVKFLKDSAEVIDAEYVTCVQNTCLAQAPADDATLKTLGAVKTGTFRFQDRTRRNIDIVVSLEGLSDALASHATKQ